jgi:hypothetical protein
MMDILNEKSENDDIFKETTGFENKKKSNDSDSESDDSDDTDDIMNNTTNI